MKKNNIRSIRFSDNLAELINRQAGNTFTEKFENLVTRCVWELPQKERELERLNQEISERRQQLGRISHTARSLSHQLTDMSCKVMELSAAIARAQEQEW